MPTSFTQRRPEILFQISSLPFHHICQSKPQFGFLKYRQAYKIKKDALWKPLLRQFRRYIKKQAPSSMEKQSLHKRYGLQTHKQDRDPTKIQQLALQLYDAFDLPLSLRTLHNAFAVLLLVQSHKMTRKRVLLPYFQIVMEGSYQSIVDVFLSVFHENSRALRVKFFSNKLIQILWQKFVNQQSGTVRKFLFKLVESDQSRSTNPKRQLFEEDLNYLESQTGF